jgi:hypothetical protein
MLRPGLASACRTPPEAPCLWAGGAVLRGSGRLAGHRSTRRAQVTTDIIHLHDFKLHLYKGNFAQFEEMYEQKRKEVGGPSPAAAAGPTLVCRPAAALPGWGPGLPYARRAVSCGAPVPLGSAPPSAGGARPKAPSAALLTGPPRPGAPAGEQGV